MKADLTLNCLRSYLQGKSNFGAKYFADNLSFFKQQVFVEMDEEGVLKKTCRFSSPEESHRLFKHWREDHSRIYWAWTLDKHSYCAVHEPGTYLVSYGSYDAVITYKESIREQQITLENLCQKWSIPTQKIQSFSFVKLRGLSF